MSIYSTKVTTTENYPNAGFFCPVCHNDGCIGSINVTFDIDWHPLPDDIPVPVMCGAIEKCVHVICPYCKNDALIVDAPISGLLKALNDDCFFTKFSCDGQEGGNCYIMFYHMEDILAILHHFAECNGVVVDNDTYCLNQECDEELQVWETRYLPQSYPEGYEWLKDYRFDSRVIEFRAPDYDMETPEEYRAKCLEWIHSMTYQFIPLLDAEVEMMKQDGSINLLDRYMRWKESGKRLRDVMMEEE